MRAQRRGAGTGAAHWKEFLRLVPVRASPRLKEFNTTSLTAHWHDKGADWRGLAHSPAHRRSRLSDSVKNGNAFRTVHNAALPAR